MLVTQESLQYYFYSCLNSSLRKHNVNAKDYTVIYLTNLLINFTRSENFISANEGRSPHKPLALHYSDALNSPSDHERNIALRRLGDIALFVCGLFSNSLKSKVVDVDYYAAMGGTAYSHLSESQNISSSDSIFNEVFYELSRKFIDFADVLSEINENQENSNNNLLRTYELWLKTGSQKAKNLLIASGIQPIDLSQNTTKH
ncbi:MAG: hypothetical protein P8X88_04055 [Gammaproteobacteria bacterium]